MALEFRGRYIAICTNNLMSAGSSQNRFAETHRALCKTSNLFLSTSSVLTMSPVSTSPVTHCRHPHLLKRSAIEQDPLLILPIVFGILIFPIALALLALTTCCCGRYALKFYRTHMDHGRDAGPTHVDTRYHDWHTRTSIPHPQIAHHDRGQLRIQQHQYMHRPYRPSSPRIRVSKQPHSPQNRGSARHESNGVAAHHLPFVPYQSMLPSSSAQHSTAPLRLSRGSIDSRPLHTSGRRYNSHSRRDLPEEHECSSRANQWSQKNDPARLNSIRHRRGQPHQFERTHRVDIEDHTHRRHSSFAGVPRPLYTPSPPGIRRSYSDNMTESSSSFPTKFSITSEKSNISMPRADWLTHPRHPPWWWSDGPHSPPFLASAASASPQPHGGGVPKPRDLGAKHPRPEQWVSLSSDGRPGI